MNGEVIPGTIVTRHRIEAGGDTPAPPGRLFFVCLDGTWNEERSDSGEPVRSNVRKLYDALDEDGPRQLARYFRGVGNSQDNSSFRRRWHGFTGSEERRIRRHATAIILKEYRPGDQIILIGFSRGAACARRLAADLAVFGLPEGIEITWQRVANRMTRQVENRFVDFKASGKTRPLPIAFLGCWDTVGAFVLPIRMPGQRRLDRVLRALSGFGQRLRGDIPFRNLTLAENVGRAVHCVAIDETRNAFLPALMNAEERVEEVWFPGVHADVGGAYPQDGLGRVSLRFMIDRLNAMVRERSLLPIQWVEESVHRDASWDANTEFDFHFHGLNRGLRLNGKRVRRIGVRGDEGAMPKIHESVSRIWQSDRVFSRNAVTGRRWRIDYDPFNIKELQAENEDGGDRRNYEWVSETEDAETAIRLDREKRPVPYQN